MSYLGQVELKSSEIRRVDVTGSTSATHTLTWTPASEQSLIITINGIKQQNNYSISGVTLTLDDALLSDDKMEVIGILDIGEATIPPDDSITTAMVKDDAIDADKLANSINTEIAANTAKVTNATHTGDVTGATALTIATDAVDIAMLSATGTASATTFLRGDNAWAAAGGLTEADCWRLTTDFDGDADPIASNLERADTDGFGLLGTGMTESSGIFSFPSTGYWLVRFHVSAYLSSGDNRHTECGIDVTENDSSYDEGVYFATFIQNTGGGTRSSQVGEVIIDVTSISNIKVRFVVANDNSATTIVGNTGKNYTYMVFLKLADT